MKSIITIAILLISLTINAQETDTLELARKTTTPAEVLNSIADATTKHFNGEQSLNIIRAITVNTNSSENTINKIAIFLTQQNPVNQDLLLALSSRSDISQKTLNDILLYIEGKSELYILDRFCWGKLKF